MDAAPVEPLVPAASIDAEARFRLLADTAPVLVWRADPENRGIWFNRPWLEFTGRTMEQELGYGWAEAIHPEDRERATRHCQSHLEQRLPFEMEFRLRRHDGQYRWMLDRGVPVFDGPGGCFSGYLGTCSDITERKEVEEALHREIARRARTEAQLELVLSSINDHVVMYDRNWCYTFVNEGAARMLGKTREEMIGRCIWELFPEAVGNQYYQELHKAVAEQRIIRSEHYFTPWDRWYENHIYPTPDGVTVFSSDITWRKRAEEVVKQTDRRKDEFIALLSHELRNPLAPLRNGLQLMKAAGLPTDMHQRAYEIMDRQLMHLVRLVDDLLDVSRITRGTLELRREYVTLASVIERAVETTSHLFEDARHDLRVDLPDAPVWLYADPVRLAQVFANLLNNSAKYTPPGGQVSLEARVEHDEVEIRVEDNGVGISAELLPHIFRMFTRGESPLQYSTAGNLGIGLAVVKSLVELHGGAITAESQGKDRGSLFSVRLPRMRPEL